MQGPTRRSPPCGLTAGVFPSSAHPLRPSVSLPPTNRFRPYQSRRHALRHAHLQRIAVRQVTWNIARIEERNIRPLFSQLHVVSLVFEPVRKQTRSAILPPRHRSKQHKRLPTKSRVAAAFQDGRLGSVQRPNRKSTLILQIRPRAREWSHCGKLCIV